MELIIITAIVMFIVFYTKMVNFDELFDGEGKIGKLLKEKDYEFYAMAKYGGDVDINYLFNRRIKNTGFTLVIVVIFLIFNFTVINLSVGVR